MDKNNSELEKQVKELKGQLLEKNRQLGKMIKLSVTHDQELGKRNKEIAELKRTLRGLG